MLIRTYQLSRLIQLLVRDT